MPAPTMAYCMPVDLLAVTLAVLVQQATACGLRFAGSVSCFTSIAIDRARRSSPVARSCQRSIGSVLTANKRRHIGVACVCKSMKLGMHSV